VHHAYEPLFEANENAHQLAPEQLRGLIAQVAGTDEDMTKRIAYTFSALARSGDFSTAPRKDDSVDDESERDEEEAEGKEKDRDKPRTALRPEFHYNLQIHLPANGTEETYLNIFNALRKVFQ
jgi:hypothetical protein